MRLIGRIAATVTMLIGSRWDAGAANLQLKYVVIVTRHGVRSPTWKAERLNQYSAEPWPEWGVPPGYLTPQGRTLIKLLGAYYGEWLESEHLLKREGCGDTRRVYIRADRDQRTVETGRAFGESLLPGCTIPVHSGPEGEKDTLFSGAGDPDPDLALKALRQRFGSDPGKAVAEHRKAFAALESILHRPLPPQGEGESAELKGPLAIASTLSEDFQLEYANGMKGSSLGWGRLNADNLYDSMELHAAYADITRRSIEAARARGSNMLAHLMRSMEQAVSGQPVPGAIGSAGDAVLIVSGHDTNLSNLSGMLGLSWKLPGYQPDDTPAGGALIFSLWRDDTHDRFVLRTRYVAQTLEQMRNMTPLSLATPPASQELTIPGCEDDCTWTSAHALMTKAIDPQYVSRQ